jgi:hypothetical protein
MQGTLQQSQVDRYCCLRREVVTSSSFRTVMIASIGAMKLPPTVGPAEQHQDAVMQMNDAIMSNCVTFRQDKTMRMNLIMWHTAAALKKRTPAFNRVYWFTVTF